MLALSIIFLTRLLWVCINRIGEGRSVISSLSSRGKIGDEPAQWDALLLEPRMLKLNQRPLSGVDPSRSASGLADQSRQPRLRWMNFSFCPHCVANGRPYMLPRLTEWGPMISRSDGVNFHLVLGDRPIEYPAERAAGKTEMMSAGFWYLHEANGDSMETVVVILRSAHGCGVSLLRHLELVADRLYEKLRKSSRLSCLYKFDGQHLHQVVH